jgi:hypothetical protein
MLTILAAFLVAGILFLLLPIGVKRNPGPILKTRRLHLQSIRATVIFVGELRQTETIEGALVYKLLNSMRQSPGKRERYVWLLHGPCPEQVAEIP